MRAVFSGKRIRTNRQPVATQGFSDLSLLSERTPPNHCTATDSAGSCLLFASVFPYFFPLQIQNGLNKALHAFRAVLLHRLSEMGVTVQGESGGGVSQVPLYRLDVITGPDSVDGIRVPLWHNKGKTENPCVATGWRFVLILFPLKTALKWGLREGVKNQGYTLRTNFFRPQRRLKWEPGALP